jgi:Histidine kinase-like ATPase domain
MKATHPAQAGLRPVAGPVPIGAFVSGHFGDAAAWQIPADPRSVPQARALCRQTALKWAVPTAAAQDAESIVSELISNAVLHGGPPIYVQLGRAAGELLAAVYDASDKMPTPRQPGEWDRACDVTGRGLSMVIPALTSRWTITRCDRGKIVTAYLAVELAAAGAPRCPCDGPPLAAVLHGGQEQCRNSRKGRASAAPPWQE